MITTVGSRSRFRGTRIPIHDWLTGVTIGLVAVLLLAACSAAEASPSPVDSAGAASTSPMATPGSSDAPTPTPQATDTPSVAPTPSPSPVVHKWSAPTRVDSALCATFSLVIDDNGGRHIAADCTQGIRYSSSTADGWTTREFTTPSHRVDQNPQLGVDGGIVYLAYSRVAIGEGGCGDDGLSDVGTFYRTRSLDSASWSTPVRIGVVTDTLGSFRVRDGVVHATVLDSRNNGVYYVRVSEGTTTRALIRGAIATASLRIGDDGRARVAYETARGIRYAVFNGSSFSTATLPKSDGGFDPQLVLDAGGHAHVLWTRAYHGGGCAEAGPDPRDGTYYASNATGTWVSTRISRQVSGGSMTVDRTGLVHVLMPTEAGLQYLTHRPGAGWTRYRMTDKHVGSPVIKIDPSSGAIVAAYVSSQNRIYVMTLE